MKSFETGTLINARQATVWEVITDGRNYTVWASGITYIDGDLRHSGTIRVRARTGGNRAYRLRVGHIPGEEMIWTAGLPLGLFKGVRTFALTPHGGKTLLRIRQEFTGPLLALIWKRVPDVQRDIAEYLSAVKSRAELLGRYEDRIHPAPGRPWHESVTDQAS